MPPPPPPPEIFFQRKRSRSHHHVVLVLASAAIVFFFVLTQMSVRDDQGDVVSSFDQAGQGQGQTIEAVVVVAKGAFPVAIETKSKSPQGAPKDPSVPSPVANDPTQELDSPPSSSSSTPPLPPPPLYNHCVFMITSLWGTNHTDERKLATLDWYARATVHSIHKAAEFADASPSSSRTRLKHVGMLLMAKDWYDTQEARDYIFAHADNGTSSNSSSSSPTQQSTPDVSFILENHSFQMRKRLQVNQCDILSVVRVDADDMLTPRAFVNLHQGWDKASARCTPPNGDRTSSSASTSSDCPVVMVSGTQSIKTLNLLPINETMARDTDPRQTEPCLSIETKRATEFYSLGLTVTMTKDVWMEHFGGNSHSCTHYHHRLLFKELTAEMKEKNIATFKNLVNDHGLYMKTMLSGHFDFVFESKPYKTSGCGLQYLKDSLGEDSGTMVWEVREYTPNLTQEAFQQNHFVIEQLKLKNESGT